MPAAARPPPIRRSRSEAEPGAAVDPDREPDRDQAKKGEERVAGVDLLDQHPHQPGDRAVEREGEQLLEPNHPWPRPRQASGDRRHRGRQHDRRGEAGPDHDKDRQRQQRRRDQRGAERGAHERRGARGRDDRRQHAGGKGAGQPGALREAAADPGERDAEIGDARTGSAPSRTAGRRAGRQRPAIAAESPSRLPRRRPAAASSTPPSAVKLRMTPAA